MIAMRSNSMTGSNRFLNLPLRPGDVVVIPSGGQVAVIGWVYTPGSFKVTSGLSALSAIGAAGGPTFAANEHDVHLLRNEKDGTTRSISLDLAKVRSGEEADITVQGNDVIEVPYSNSKIVPYIVYNILQSKVGGSVMRFEARQTQPFDLSSATRDQVYACSQFARLNFNGLQLKVKDLNILFLLCLLLSSIGL